MTIKFKLKRPDSDETALLTQFKRNGTKFTLFPGKSVPTEHWSISKNKPKDSHPAATELNAFLKTWTEELEKIFLKLENEKQIITNKKVSEELEKVFKQKVEKIDESEALTFVKFFDNFIKKNENKFSDSYLSILRQNRKHLICALNLVSKKELDYFNSLSIKKKGTFKLEPSVRLEFADVNKALFERFENYLYTATYIKAKRGVEVEDNYTIKYIAKHMKELLRIIREAQSEKLAEYWDTFKIAIPDEDADSIYTPLDQLREFIDLKLIGEQEEVRDLYVCNSFLGLRYSDLEQVNEDKFESETILGEERIVFLTKQKKTGKPVRFPVDKNAEVILRKYNFRLPKISASVFNRVIKEVAELIPSMCEKFTKTETRGKKTTEHRIFRYLLISSHTARRSFCTNYYKLGVKIQVIMAISGHSTEEQLMTYIKATLDVEVIAEETANVPNLFEPPVKLKKAS